MQIARSECVTISEGLDCDVRNEVFISARITRKGQIDFRIGFSVPVFTPPFLIHILLETEQNFAKR
jgi:hypothetical protein